MQEEWRDVPGYEGLYKVSDQGRVMSMNYRGRQGVSRVITPNIARKGYRQVRLYRGGSVIRVGLVHRLVMLAFVGASDMQVNHKDGITSNNKLDNLEYCTGSKNVMHAIETLGRYNPKNGKRIHFAKLVESQVVEIKKLLRDGRQKSDIAKTYGVSDRCIRHIANGANWSWVK